MDRALSEISSKQVTEWLAWSKLEPWGEELADLRHAVLCTILINLWRDRKKGKAAEVKDFRLFPPLKGRKAQRLADAKKAIANMVLALGGKVVKKDGNDR